MSHTNEKKSVDRGSSTVRLSKSLAWLLRHNAESEGFKMMEGGYLPVKDVLKHRRFQGFTVEDVKEVIIKQYHKYETHIDQVVETCNKQRYALKEGDNGELLI